MANTISLLSYANTFGDWIITTNNLVQENNQFVANTYHKPTGTLFLDDPVLGLEVASNAIVSGRLQVQGIGSASYVQNTLQVDGTIYANNVTVSNNFIINGATSYNSNNFTLNANNTIGTNSSVSVRRGNNTSASLRWNEPAKYWDILDITNGNYYQVVTTEFISNDVNSTSTTTVPSSNILNSVYNIALTAYNKATNISSSTLGVLNGDITSSTFTTNSITQTIVDSFPISTYRSAKYQVQMTSGTKYHIIELHLVHNGTSVFMSQYGEIFTATSLGIFDANIANGNVNLLFIAANPVTTIKLIRSEIYI
jgi:hypothetical protein